MPRRDDVLLAELFDCVLAVRSYLERGGAEWFTDPALEDAVLLRLIRIGEIAGLVSEPRRASHPEVPWSRMRGFRNVALHEYFRLDMSRVRPVAEDEVPVLHEQILQVLRADFPDIARKYEQEV